MPKTSLNKINKRGNSAQYMHNLQDSNSKDCPNIAREKDKILLRYLLGGKLMQIHGEYMFNLTTLWLHCKLTNLT